MIIKENNYYTRLYTYNGLDAYIKAATYKNSFGELKDVITELVITKEGTKEIVYKNISMTWICYYNDINGLSIVNIIEDILYYLANNDYKNSYKHTTIDDVLSNKYIAMLNIKRFRKEHNEKLLEVESIKKAEIINKQIEDLEIEVNNIVTKINGYELMRYNKPNKINNYNYEFITQHTYKTYSKIYGTEAIKLLKDIITHLETYLNYIENDFDPINFLKFDKVA